LRETPARGERSKMSLPTAGTTACRRGSPPTREPEGLEGRLELSSRLTQANLVQEQYWNLLYEVAYSQPCQVTIPLNVRSHSR